MNQLILILIAHNEKEAVKLAIESIRKFSDVDNLSVIVVDNFSSDGLGEWAGEQTDFTYVLMDEQQMPVGAALNEVIEGLGLQGDLLIMEGHCLITPGCLVRMRDVLYSNEKTGAVGGLANSFLNYQRLENLDNYEEAVLSALSTEGISSKEVLGLCSDAVLFKKELLEEVGRFDERLKNQRYVMKDYCFRAVEKDWKLKVCNSAYMWNAYGAEYDIPRSTEDDNTLRKKWGTHYFNSLYNENLIAMLVNDSEDAIKVLEIGCDCGATLLEIKNRYPYAGVYGYEINEKAAEIASHIAEVKVGNIEDGELDYPKEMFDYIIFGDVLEHLKTPLEVIRYCRQFLKKNGYILANIPNLMHISVMAELLKGNFTYTETGLLDYTHIHLFTYNEIVKMFQEGQYKIDSVKMTNMPTSEEEKELIDKLLGLQKESARFMYEAFQFQVRAQKR